MWASERPHGVVTKRVLLQCVTRMFACWVLAVCSAPLMCCRDHSGACLHNLTLYKKKHATPAAPPRPRARRRRRPQPRAGAMLGRGRWLRGGAGRGYIEETCDEACAGSHVGFRGGVAVTSFFSCCHRRAVCGLAACRRPLLMTPCCCFFPLLGLSPLPRPIHSPMPTPILPSCLQPL